MGSSPQSKPAAPEIGTALFPNGHFHCGGAAAAPVALATCARLAITRSSLSSARHTSSITRVSRSALDAPKVESRAMLETMRAAAVSGIALQLPTPALRATNAGLRPAPREDLRPSTRAESARRALRATPDTWRL